MILPSSPLSGDSPPPILKWKSEQRPSLRISSGTLILSSSQSTIRPLCGGQINGTRKMNSNLNLPQTTQPGSKPLFAVRREVLVSLDSEEEMVIVCSADVGFRVGFEVGVGVAAISFLFSYVDDILVLCLRSVARWSRLWQILFRSGSTWPHIEQQ